MNSDLYNELIEYMSHYSECHIRFSSQLRFLCENDTYLFENLAYNDEKETILKIALVSYTHKLPFFIVVHGAIDDDINLFVYIAEKGNEKLSLSSLNNYNQAKLKLEKIIRNKISDETIELIKVMNLV